MKNAANLMQLAPRCGAYARTTGKPCMAPAVRGKHRCRMHGGKSPGRPAIHGRYTLAVKEEKRRWRDINRRLRELIKELDQIG
jgi:hypothetical protein